MRHGQFPKTTDQDQSSPVAAAGARKMASAGAKPPACPFAGAYSRAVKAPLREGPERDELKAVIEKIAAARSSGVDFAPPPKADEDPKLKINPEDRHIPAGYTYFGQLVVHDLTHSIMTRMRDNPTPKVENLSTPSLDLDTIYGSGPDLCPLLYQPAYMRVGPGRNDDDQYLFVLGRTAKAALPENWREGYGLPFDLPRVEAEFPGIAKTGVKVGITPVVHDDRNDDNLVLAQLTALFMLVHNTVSSYLSRNGDPTANDDRKLSNRESFELARHFMLKAYRRIIVYDFLNRLLHPDVYQELMANDIKGHGHVPLEFAFGAGRVGHAMVRASYTINEHIRPSVSGLGRMMSFSGHTPDANLPLPADWVIDWRRFLEIDNEDGITPQSARRISPFMAPTFVHGRLTTRSTDLEGSLSFHDLWRCYQLGMPTGQQCAEDFGAKSAKVLSEEEMKLTPVFEDLHTSGNLKDALEKCPAFLKETPLSYYLLQEAAVRCNGRYLGQLGSYIYATTIMQGFNNSPPIPTGHSGLAFKDIVGDTGIKKLPRLLAILDLPDSELKTVIVDTLKPRLKSAA